MDKVWVITCFEHTKDKSAAFGVEAVTDSAKNAAKILKELFDRKCHIYGVQDLLRNEYYREGEGFRLSGDDMRFCCVGAVRGIEVTRTSEFPVSFVMRDDLKEKGFDVSNIDDGTMESIASRMNEYSCNGVGYWDALIEAARYYEIPTIDEEDEQ